MESITVKKSVEEAISQITAASLDHYNSIFAQSIRWPSVRLESGEVGTELRNTLGGGKMQESGNAEGAGKRKCGRSGNAERAEMRKAECDRIVGRWMNGRGVTERRTDGRKKDRRMEEGRTDRRKDGRNVLRRCERLGLSLCAVPSLNGTVCVFLFGRVGVTERA